MQEILNNIIKHAQASLISIKLEYLNEQLKLEIVDNGIGFNTENLPAGQRGMGIQNIQKRAGIIGGEAIIKSNEGSGVCVSIFIPYP